MTTYQVEVQIRDAAMGRHAVFTKAPRLSFTVEAALLSKARRRARELFRQRPQFFSKRELVLSSCSLTGEGQITITADYLHQREAAQLAARQSLGVDASAVTRPVKSRHTAALARQRASAK